MKKSLRQNQWFARLLVILTLCIGLLTLQTGQTFAMDDTGDDSASPGIDSGEDDAADPSVDDAVGDEDDDIAATPTFSNPAQAQHAAQLAAEVASRGDEETQLAQNAVSDAEAALAEAELSEDQEAIDLAMENLQAAEEAYADKISELTGVISQDISDMRSSGMGWGNIAHELGVSPGLLGLGHGHKSKSRNRNRNREYAAPQDDSVVAGTIQAGELAEATARDTKYGWSQGHGVALNAGVHSPGTGLGGAASSHGGKGGSKGGISGASGLGSGQGRGGGNNAGGQSGGIAGGQGGPGNSGKGGGSSNSSSGVAGKGGQPGNSGNSNAGGNGRGGGNSNSNAGGNGKGGGNSNSNAGGNGNGNGKK